jgi:hypothetical protein
MEHEPTSGGCAIGCAAEPSSATAIVDELHERYRQLTEELGGAAGLGYMQRSLVERAVWLEYWLVSQERALAEGREVDIRQWTLAVNGLQGLYARLGVSRPTQAGPTSLMEIFKSAFEDEDSPMRGHAPQ